MRGEVCMGGRDSPFFIRVARTEGEPIEAAGARIVPRALEVQITGRDGRSMLAWARPLSVEVERDGEWRKLPIRDVTRGNEFLLVGAAIGLFSRIQRFFY